MTTTARLLHVNSFAPAPFTGNPAAVLVLEREPSDDFAARAGAELNQPATAVVWPPASRAGSGCAGLPRPASWCAAQPDLAALRRLPVRGLIITAPGPGADSGGADSGGADGGGADGDGADQADFVSRFFAPGTGIDEDPVTGSAHCALAPYWIGRLGRQPLLGRQLSTRGGVLRVAQDGDSVLLAGPALVLAEGSWQGPLG